MWAAAIVKSHTGRFSCCNYHNLRLSKHATSYISDQPNNYGNQDCVNLITANVNFGKIHDVECVDTVHASGVICKKAAGMTSYRPWISKHVFQYL